MKLKMLRFSIIASSLVITAIVLRSGGAQGVDGSHSSQTATQEKTIEQVQKNIKVLTGMPQSQLIPVMNFFAASLGRRCNFCHVNNNGQWDYASDAKPEKNTAREMIRLVLDTNKTLSRLNVDPISCYSCHRGRTSPQSVPTLPLPLPSPGAAGNAAAPGAQAQASPGPRPELPSADDIFAKYIQALGGQTAIDKLKSRVSKGTLTQANGNVLQFEAYQVAPDKFYQVVTTQQGAFERGYNGSVGWEKSARGLRELLPAEVAQLKANSGLFSLINLKGQLTRPRVTKDKIGDRDVYVITGTTAEGGRQRLFFDVESGLLLRRITYTSTMVATIPEEVDFEDYHDVEGIKFPVTARSSTIEVGNPISTRKFTEIKLNVPVDDSKFNMPAAAPKPAASPE